MGHCISALILRGNYNADAVRYYDLQGIKLNYDLTMFFIDHYYTACWAEVTGILGKLPGKSLNLTFPDDLVVAYLIDKISAQTKPLYAVIQTDYFGGIGEQWARVYQGDRFIDENIISINSALACLGVEPNNGLDEFDTIGLSKYRSMPEYLEKYHDVAEEWGI